jgi:hypothetical protein
MKRFDEPTAIAQLKRLIANYRFGKNPNMLVPVEFVFYTFLISNTGRK